MIIKSIWVQAISYRVNVYFLARKFSAFSIAEILSFHPVKSGRYHNFGYGKSLSYDMDNSEYHGIYDYGEIVGSIFCFLSLIANQTLILKTAISNTQRRRIHNMTKSSWNTSIPLSI